MRVEVYNLRKHLGIPDSLVNSTARGILDGHFLSNVLQGKWQFADGVPHPRQLQGCGFWTSWEVTLIFGTDFCAIGGYRSLRMTCPEACACTQEEPACPLSCPRR